MMNLTSRIEQLISQEDYSTARGLAAGALNSCDKESESIGRLALYVAICEQKLGLLSEALENYRAAEEASRINDDRVTRGRAKLGVGAVLFHQSEYSESQEELRGGFELLRDSSENLDVAEIQKYLGWCALRVGKTSEGRIWLEDSLSTFRRIGRHSEVAKIKNQLAHVLYIRGSWQSATEALEEAIRIAKEAKDYYHLTTYYCNYGILACYQGSLRTAESFFRKSLKLKHKLGIRSSPARNQLALGKLYSVQRHFPKARRHLDEGLAMAQEKGMKREVAIGHEYLGELAYEMGDYDRAGGCYEEARLIAEAIAPDGDLINEIYRRIGDLKVRTGDLKGAWRATERALAVSDSLGDRFEGSLTLRVRARIMKEKRKRPEALSHYLRCIRALGALGEKYERARTHLEVGALFVVSRREEDDLRQAAHHLNTAMDLFDALDIGYYRARTAVEMARLFAVQGEDRKAIERIEYAAGLCEGTDDEREIHFRVREVCTILEEALVDRILEERIADDASTPVAPPPPDVPYTLAGLERILFPVMRATQASRCFVARRDGARGEFKVSVAKAMSDDEARRLLTHFRTVDRRIFSEKRPFLSIDLSTDRRFESIRNRLLFGVRSLIAVPFGVEKEIEGILYVDRESVRLDEPFLYTELKTLADHARSLAFFVAAMERDELRRDNITLRRQLDRRSGFDNIITQDDRMMDVLDTVARVRDSNIPVLLIGETGTGKELVAKALHYTGARKNQRYMAVNCAALPENLLESELFGHRKGAFTGATVDKKGLFEVCDHGTFFLDEIADMGLSTQVKLLRVLENGEIKRLGDTAVRTVNVRIVSATNRDLMAEVEAGRFRADLFYRLNGIKVEIPPLRERRADIPILISHFIERYAAEEEKEIRGVTPDALNILVSHEWPGNVRELLNEIRRAVTLAEDGDAIGPYLLSERVRRRLYGDGDGDRDEPGGGSTLPELMASFERQRIFIALKEARWIKTRAARNLGIHEATLRGKMRRYGLEVPDPED
jgi:Nif-specific regulatory protein